MELTLHDVVKIESGVKKDLGGGGRGCYVRSIYITLKNGEEMEVSMFADSKSALSIINSGRQV